MGANYCTREDVKAALGYETALNDAQVDRAIEANSRSVDKLTHRVFYPTLATRYFAWPDESDRAPSWRLWLDDNELISLTSITSGGTTISTADVFLEPQSSGPPYNRLELDRSSDAVFGGGSTPQRDVAVRGVYGYQDEQVAAGATAEALDLVELDLDITDGSLIGVGDILTVDSERFLVTGRSWITSTQTLQAPLTAAKNSVTVAVTTGSSYHTGEIILLDSERMLITDVAGNNLTVKRAIDGSVLATHTGSTIYVSRTLTITRGALGTTAATHLTAAPITKLLVPGPVKSLAVAGSVAQIQDETSGEARSAGSGESARAGQAGLEGLRAQVYNDYGRKARMRSI